MFHLDHFALGVRDLADGARRLVEETGLGGYEGGIFPEVGVRSWIFPLGGDVYLEVEAATNPG